MVFKYRDHNFMLGIFLLGHSYFFIAGVITGQVAVSTSLLLGLINYFNLCVQYTSHSST